MSLRRISIASALLLSLGGAVALANPNPLFPQSIAQNPGGPGQGGPGQMRLMEELNLTAEQQQRMQGIRSKYEGNISQRQQELRQAAEQLSQLMAGNASTPQIRAQHDRVQDLSQQLGDLRFESMLEMRDVLTVEQRNRFAQLMEQRRENVRNQGANRRGQ